MRVLHARMDPDISGVLVTKQTVTTVVLREGLDPELEDEVVQRLLAHHSEMGAEDQQDTG